MSIAKELEYLETRWHSKTAAIFGFLFVSSLVFSVGKPLVGTTNAALVGVAFGLVLLFAWIRSNRLPQTPPDKIGIVIGLRCDSPDHQKRVTADLLENLRRHICDSTAPLCLVEVPAWALHRLADHDQAAVVFEEMRGHLFVFGTVRERNVDGRASHIVQLNGIVRHAPLPASICSQILVDLKQALPNHVIIDKANDAFQFELTSDLLSLGAKYVIGVAAFASGDFPLAERLLLFVEGELTKDRVKASGLHRVKKRVVQRLSELYDAWLIGVLFRFNIRGEALALQAMDEISSKVLERNRLDYNGLLTKAICEFSLRRNIDRVCPQSGYFGNADCRWRCGSGASGQ